MMEIPYSCHPIGFQSSNMFTTEPRNQGVNPSVSLANGWFSGVVSRRVGRAGPILSANVIPFLW